MGQTSIGMSYLLKGMEMAQEVHDRSAIMSGAKRLSEAYEKTGDWKNALTMMHVYNENKDSLINEKNSSNMEEMQVLFKTSEKDREIDQLSGEKRLKDAELSRQRTIIFSSIGAGILILVLAFVLWNSNYSKRKANLELAKAYLKIENKNQQITDSINYSKRIQNTILPPIDLLSKNLKKFFIYYEPKDIVTGDLGSFVTGNLVSFVTGNLGPFVTGNLGSFVTGDLGSFVTGNLGSLIITGRQN
jgi:hypothetical protein